MSLSTSSSRKWPSSTATSHLLNFHFLLSTFFQMQLQDDNAPYDQVNITPMVDLVFVLLVIFILMCTASVQGMKVNLPKASTSAPSLAKPKTKSITITNDG